MGERAACARAVARADASEGGKARACAGRAGVCTYFIIIIIIMPFTLLV